MVICTLSRLCNIMFLILISLSQKIIVQYDFIKSFKFLVDQKYKTYTNIQRYFTTNIHIYNFVEIYWCFRLLLDIFENSNSCPRSAMNMYRTIFDYFKNKQSISVVFGIMVISPWNKKVHW